MEVAGLALGAAGIAGIFSTCMECFDIFVAGKNFSDDYEQICALFSAQRLRFGLWGESVGFMDDGSSERRAKFETVLGRSDIRITLEGLLNTIRSILTEGSLLDTRYGLAVDPASTDLVQARGMNIFKHSFDHFKERIRRNQKETSVREKARWAFHDAKKFESMTDRLEKCMNSLESITRTSFGLLVEQQQLRLKEEIEQIADIEDVELLHDASSSLSSTHRSLADSESRRFTRDVAASILERHSIVSGSTFRSGETSYRTAPSQLHSDMSILHEKRQRSGSNLGDQSSTRQSSFDMKIPGSWSYKSYHRLTQRPNLRPVAVQAESSRQTCEQCKEEHYKCDARPTSNRESRHCRRCWNLQRECSFQADQEVFVAQEGTSEYLPEPIADGSEIPQNQRMLRGLLKGSDHRKPLIFQSGDGDYGSQLAPFKLEDESYWVNNSGKLISHAQNGSSAVKRMFMELRHIKSGKVPFVSATALDDRLDRVLACIEGPPDTPYEGGIFWIAVTIPESDPNGPPLMRFHTRIYHPNISPRGDICADYQEKWSSVLAFGPQPARDTSGMWYSAKSTEVRWTLGALLTAICGLLASPDVDDPLVPEIAQKYVEDFEGYCEAAKIYTKNFATRPRPDVSDIIFPEIEKSPGRTETPDQWNSAVTQEQDREMIIPAGGSHENYDSPVPSTRAFSGPLLAVKKTIT
ncbi:ubiquitin-conjugating enzyme E2-16 kDa [Phlyctema vagabunda]|uniref:Ubiquitin-conjugating enzyme E2-16 kDa n=1 Tax=Phlyctema vagabunda TaxID=108571 RepID=A0ABR4PSN3_9HELO